MKKQDLINGDKFEFSDDEGLHLLEVMELEGNKKHSWAGKFGGWFNCKFFSFKTWKGFENHVNKLILKHDLKLTGHETI